MKTKSAHKKGKKRPFRESSLSSKADQISENVVESKKSRKRTKIDNTIQNGDSVPKTKVQMLTKKVDKQKKKQKKVKEQNNDNIGKLSKAKVKRSIAEETKPTAAESKEKALNEAKEKKEKKLEHLKSRQLIREMNKAMPQYRRTTRYKAPKDLDLEVLKNKVTEIRSRKVLTKSAKKKISVLIRKIGVAERENKSKKAEIMETDNKNKQQNNVPAKNEQKANIKGKKRAKREYNKKRKGKIEEDNENAKDSNDEDQNDIEEEEEEKMDITQEKVDAKSIEDEENDNEDDDEEDDETSIVVVKKKKKKAADQSSDMLKKKDIKKKQCVLFVTNLPYNITSNELKQYFLSKVNTVISIDMPIRPRTKRSRGCAFVKLSNNADCEKALLLNNTFLKKKKINVGYATAKNVNEVNVAVKNKKLETFSKTEQFVDVKGKKKLSKKKK